MRESILSMMARSDYYQTLYREYREGRLEIFKNRTELTGLQVAFLKWLEIFHIIKEDIINKEPCAFKDIVNSPMRVQAYLVYKFNKRNKSSTGNKRKRKDTKVDERIIFTKKDR